MERFAAVIIMVGMTLLTCVAADAEDIGGYSTSSIIEGTVAQGAMGRIGVNMAAGDYNLQSNATALAFSRDGTGVARTSVVQNVTPHSVTLPDTSASEIKDGAFSGVSGAIAINQASGIANAQANSVAIAFGTGVKLATETDLSQTVSNARIHVSTQVHGQQRHAYVGDKAFIGARGIVQLNQAAGSANATGNNFALRFQMDAPK